VLPELQGNDQANQIFLKEVKAVAQFHHPNVADVFDLEAADGKLILATEFIPGATLEEVASAFRTSKLRIPLGMVLMAVRDTALALQYAHTFTNVLGEPQPVFHGTLSPKTVQVTFEGLTKVLDFARPRAALLQRSSANDLSALGATVHLVLAENPQDAQLASRTDLTPELRTALARLVAADPQHRFTSALDFAKALEATAAQVIWRPEQAAQLVQRMFTERRDEIRHLLSQLEEQGSSTAVMPLSKVFTEGTAPRSEDPPTIPPGGMRVAPPVPEGGPDTLPPEVEANPEEATRPRAPIPRPGGLSEADMQTVIRRSGEQRSLEAPQPLDPDNEPQTDVRQLPQPRPSPEPAAKRKGGGTALRLILVAALLGIALVLAKWKTDPEWIRSRNPQLAHSLEKLAFIPGFPKPRSPEQQVAPEGDAGVNEVAAPSSDGGSADEPPPSTDDAGSAAAKKTASDAGAAKAPAKPPPHHHHGH
jgi:eukaryotic-like serine/threonine-protein kinase